MHEFTSRREAWTYQLAARRTEPRQVDQEESWTSSGWVLARNVRGGRRLRMDPQTISTAQWDQIGRALIYLFLFGGLGLTGALAFLLAHALAPSLIASRDASALLGMVRWFAYPLAAVAALSGAYALFRSLSLAFAVANQIYPRTWI